MLHKFGSNLDFKTDGNSVIKLNSARRSSYTAGDLRFGSSHDRGHLRRRAGAEKALTWLPCASEPRYKGRDAVVIVFLLCSVFPAATAIAPASLHRLLSAVVISAKPIIAPLVPSVLSRIILDALLHQELAVHAFLPRGRPNHRRARLAVARAPRCTSVLVFGCSSFALMPWCLIPC